MSEIFTNPNQLEDWVEAAEGIQDSYGIDKALGYVIGEKFYRMVSILHYSRSTVRYIDGEKKKPDYNPIRERSIGEHRYTENLDETYEEEKAKTIEAEGLLVKFAFLICQAFPAHEIRKYFESHPRLGISHVSTPEEYEFLIKQGAIEHSIETEVEDALIFGDMMKYFGVDV